jgi:hypothetical protein
MEGTAIPRNDCCSRSLRSAGPVTCGPLTIPKGIDHDYPTAYVQRRQRRGVVLMGRPNKLPPPVVPGRLAFSKPRRPERLCQKAAQGRKKCRPTVVRKVAGLPRRLYRGKKLLESTLLHRAGRFCRLPLFPSHGRPGPRGGQELETCSSKST